MVLGNSMKRTLFIFGGVVVFTVLGFFIGSITTNWYADTFARSDDDINFSVAVFLALWLLFAMVGGYLGNTLFRRNLTRRSSGPR